MIKLKYLFIIHGGAGNEKQIYDVLKYDKVSLRIYISSLLHYSIVRDKILNLSQKWEYTIFNIFKRQ